MIRKRRISTGEQLGIVHSHQTKLRPLPYDLERAKGQGRRRLAWIGLALFGVAIAWLVFLAVR